MQKVKIEIDPNSGYCFGVVKAVETAERELKNENNLFSLGDIVHNGKEVERLNNLGLKSISTNELNNIKETKVLIRAHGEPPSTYLKAKERKLTIVDATCPVVLRLQNKIRKSWEKLKPIGGQVIIYGKKGHAEVIGLLGQTENKALIISSIDEIKNIDLNKSIHLYAQTTKSIEEFKLISNYIKNNINPKYEFKSFDTICRQVSGRMDKLIDFAKKHDLIIFVGGKKSSNAQMLYKISLKANEKTYFVSGEDEINTNWFNFNPKSIGISGATSTPPWLLQKVAEKIASIN